MAVTKVTVNLPDSTFDTIEEIAKLRNITKTEVIRQAIETDAFFRKQLLQGDSILLEHPDASKTKVVLR